MLINSAVRRIVGYGGGERAQRLEKMFAEGRLPQDDGDEDAMDES